MAGFQPRRRETAAASPAVPGATGGGERPVVLVGLMGAGKTSIGRRLARRLALPFVDADDEIAKAAGLSVEEIFARFGEAAFRDCERRVIARLLGEEPRVIATGGGAFLDPSTRDEIARRGLSVWLRADLDVLVRRTAGRPGRPLLKDGNPRQVLQRLMQVRYPVYALADITIVTEDVPIEQTVEKVLRAVRRHARSEEGEERP